MDKKYVDLILVIVFVLLAFVSFICFAGFFAKRKWISIFCLLLTFVFTLGAGWFIKKYYEKQKEKENILYY